MTMGPLKKRPKTKGLQDVVSSAPMAGSPGSESHVPRTHNNTDSGSKWKLERKHQVVSLEGFIDAIFPSSYPVYQHRGWTAFIDKLCPEALEHLDTYGNLVKLNKKETERYPPFIDFANVITTSFEAKFPSQVARLVRFQSYPNSYIPGAPSYHAGKPQDSTHSSRTPDGAAVFSDIDLQEHALNSETTTAEAKKLLSTIDDWTASLLCIEFKKRHQLKMWPAPSVAPSASSLSSSPNLRAAEIKQHGKRTYVQADLTEEPQALELAGYALETICAVGNRSHVFGLCMENMDASLWYYDRSGAVSTTAFRLRENLSLFARFIIALSALKGVDVGFQPDFIRPVDKSCVPPKNLCGWKIELEGGEVTLKTILDSRYGIVGRGTLVYSGSMKFSDGKVEDDVVVKLAWQVVSRTAEWEFTRHLKGSSVYPKEFVVRLHGIHRGVSLLVRFRKRLKLPAHSYEDRQLQIMVSERFKLIAELEDPVDVKHGLWCVFEAVYWLARAGIYHRDISVGNLGWAVRDGGICVGLPFDFDHARFIENENPPSSEHVAGTIPFMAVDLLRDITRPHIIRYDYESCFWVAWYIATSYKDGKRLYTVKNHPLLHWLRRPVATIHSRKATLLTLPASNPAPGFGDTCPDPTLKKIQYLMFTAIMALQRILLDDSSSPLWKTMDNTFTRKLLSVAISGFKGREKRHGISFLDGLEPQPDEKDNLL